MELIAYTVICLPFPNSDVTSTYTMYGKDENDALTQFRETYPLFRVKSIEKQ
jgi:hypothetical protein